MFVFLVRLRWVGKEEEGGDLLSAQKVLRGEIFGSRRSQSCSGNRLSSSNDWTDPGRLTGWQIFVLLRSPTIYSLPFFSFDLLPVFTIPFEICVLFRILGWILSSGLPQHLSALIFRVKNCKVARVAKIFYRCLILTDTPYKLIFSNSYFNLI